MERRPGVIFQTRRSGTHSGYTPPLWRDAVAWLVVYGLPFVVPLVVVYLAREAVGPWWPVLVVAGIVLLLLVVAAVGRLRRGRRAI